MICISVKGKKVVNLVFDKLLAQLYNGFAKNKEFVKQSLKQSMSERRSTELRSTELRSTERRSERRSPFPER